jgi:hypothetical protein
MAAIALPFTHHSPSIINPYHIIPYMWCMIALVHTLFSSPIPSSMIMWLHHTLPWSYSYHIHVYNICVNVDLPSIALCCNGHVYHHYIYIYCTSYAYGSDHLINTTHPYIHNLCITNRLMNNQQRSQQQQQCYALFIIAMALSLHQITITLLTQCPVCTICSTSSRTVYRACTT